jgi:hypothetical protein
MVQLNVVTDEEHLAALTRERAEVVSQARRECLPTTRTDTRARARSGGR